MTKILLADDEHLILHSLARKLTHDGTEVTAVANGADALRELQRTFYDICFLDVQLPDSNGLDLMTTVRTLSPATSIIIMTASMLSEEQQRALLSQGCHFIPKPFDLDQVQALVAQIAGRPAAGSN